MEQVEWQDRQAKHLERVQTWTRPHRERAGRGEKHPVWDFLFEYYAFRPAWLERWHPGPDIPLAGAGALEFLRWDEYVRLPDAAGGGGEHVPVVVLDVRGMPDGRRQFVQWLAQLLEQVQERPAFFGCHGLHEWAMVYRQEQEEVRHERVPLRLGAAGIASVVEALPVRCTHFDAFRFFTGAARPLNRVQPERATVPQFEQGGCLHANMDLYKWSFKLAPYAPGELVADAFELARDIRAVDMRASPYDLGEYGFAAIRIETPTGREAYEQHQRAFAARAAALRARLILLCRRLLHR